MDFYYIYTNRLVLLDISPNQDMVESQEQSEWRKVANIQSEDELDIRIHYSKQLTAPAIDLKLTRIDQRQWPVIHFTLIIIINIITVKL